MINLFYVIFLQKIYLQNITFLRHDSYFMDFTSKVLPVLQTQMFSYSSKGNWYYLAEEKNNH